MSSRYEEAVIATGVNLTDAISGTVVTGDFNGDGRTDVAYVPGGDPLGTHTWTVFLGTGTGTPASTGGLVMAPWHPVALAPFDTTYIAWGPQIVRAIDVNGDGLTDLLGWDEYYRAWRVALSTGDGFIEQWWSSPIDLNVNSDKVILGGDFNGDGKADLCIGIGGNPVRWSYLLSTGVAFQSTEVMAAHPTAKNNILSFVDGRASHVQVVAGDFNGDRRTDIVWYRSMEFCGTGGYPCWAERSMFYLFSPGTFVSGGVVQGVAAPPGGPTLIDPAPYEAPGQQFLLLAGDYNGDGLTDLDGVWCAFRGDYNAESRYVCKRQPMFWAAGSFSKVNDNGFPEVSNAAYISDGWPRVVLPGDFDGDGRSEIEFAVPRSGGIVWRQYFFKAQVGTAYPGLYGSDSGLAPECSSFAVGDFNGSGKADILCSQADGSVSLIADGPETLVFKNGTGGTTTYALDGASSYNAVPTSAQVGYPPVNPLRFPVRVVTGKTEDGHSGPSLQTTYNYSGSYTNIAKAEFRGFRSVQEIGPGGPVMKQTKFHRGEFPSTGESEDFRGRPQQVTQWVTAPFMELMRQVDYTYTRNGSDLLEAKFALPETVTTTDVNLPRDNVPHYPAIVPGSRVTKTEAFGYDAYGNRSLSVVSGSFGPKLTVETPFRPTPVQLSNGALVHVVDLERRWSDNTLLSQKSFDYYSSADGVSRQGKLKQVTQLYCSLLDPSDLERRTGCFDPSVQVDYDSSGRLSLIKEMDGSGTFRTVADIVTTEDAMGTTVVTTSYARDGSGASFAESAHLEWRFGKQDQATDKNGRVDKSSFDPFGRTVATSSKVGAATLASSSVEHVDQDPAVTHRLSYRRTTSQLAAGEAAITKEYFDGLGRTVHSVATDSSSGATSFVHTAFEFDDGGRLLKTVGPFRAPTDGEWEMLPALEGFPWSRNIYGLDGILYGVVQSDGTYGGWTGEGDDSGPTTTFAYFGETTTTTNPDGAVNETHRDYAGRVFKVVERARVAPGGTLYGAATDYTYRADGLLLSVLGPEGSCNDPGSPNSRCLLSEIKYDPLGRRIELKDPTFKDPVAVEAQGVAAPSLPWQTYYAANGEVDHTVAPSGATTGFTYDRFNRVETKCLKLPGSASCDRLESFAYDKTVDNDTGANKTDYGIGRLGSVSVTQGGNLLLVDRFHYDALGRTSAVARELTGNAGARVTQFSYDLGSRVQTMTYPDGTVLSYEYYPGTSSLKRLFGSALGANQQIVASQYDPLGQPGLVTTDVQTSFQRDPWSGNLQRIRVGPAADGSILDVGYALTPGGLIRTLSDYRLGQLIGANPAKVDFTYTYDDNARLTGESVPAAVPGDLSRSRALAYDNVTGRPSGLASVTDPVRGAFSFSYDKDGNTTSGINLSGASPTWRSFAYGADGMPSSIGSLNAFYDSDGNRAIKGSCGAAPCPAASTTYYFGPHYEVRNGVPVRYIFGLGQRLAKVDSTGTKYIHQSHQGSTLAVTSGGSTVWRGTYQLFGSLRTECANSGVDQCAPNVSVARPVPYLFGDHEYDSEVGLYYFGARYYDPEVGRFTSPDTIIPRPFDPQSHNRYAFQRNDPLNRIDPDGHCDELVGTPCVGVTWPGSSGAPSSDWPDSFNDVFGDVPVYSGSGGYYVGVTMPTPQPVPAALVNSGSISEPGLVASAIPIVGSAWGLAYNLQQGNYGWAAAYAGMLVLDVTMVGGVVAGVGKIAARLLAKEAVELGGEALLRGAVARGTSTTLGRGSTASLSKGTTLARSLREQLAIEKAMASPAAGSRLPLRMTDPRWPASDGWVKMQQIVQPGGTKGPINIHYVYNEVTGAIDDFKIVLQVGR